MATKVHTLYVDDITGDEITNEDHQTLSFAVNGVSYEIDLNEKNRAKFDKAMAPFIKNAVKVGKAPANRKATHTSRADDESRIASTFTKAARAYIREHYQPDLSDRGRIPAEYRRAYLEAYPEHAAN